jgi:putative tryptophan/tyrosine transport system substrate-binding protein
MEFMRLRNTAPRLSVRFFILLTLLSAMGGPVEAGLKVVSVQSVAVKPYDEALGGFTHAIASTGVELERIVLSTSPNMAIVRRLDAIKPDLVLAVGMGALSRIASLGEIPIVYVMVLDPAEVISRNLRVTGVRMGVAPEKQLAVVRKTFPQLKTIGLLYDPRRSDRMVGRIQRAANLNTITVNARPVSKAEAVPNALLELAGKIDLFWMLPDLTVVTPQTIEFLLLFSMDSRTPLLTFSDKYAEQGALLAISADPYDMGQQAGEMALRILNGAEAGAIPQEDARKAVVTINLKIARKLGVKIDRENMLKARILD